MSDIVLVPPLVEPVHLDEARAHLVLPSSETGQDAQIRRMVAAARRHVETYCRTGIVRQQHLLALDCFPGGAIEIPVGPLRAVQSVQYLDGDGTLQTLAGSAYRVDTYSTRARIEPAYGTVWPSTRDVVNAVLVKYTCGHVAPVSSIDAGADTIASVGHDLADDAPVRLSNSGGAVPAGLSADTQYYVKAAAADSLQLALSAGGDAVDITGAGTGTSFLGQVPDDLIAAILLLVGHLFEHREQNSDFQVYELPTGVESLLAPHRVMRF